MLHKRFAAGLALLLAPAAAFAQGEATVAPPSGPAIVAPQSDDTYYGPARKPGQPYKPPVAKPPTVPKPASSTPAPVESYRLPTISIPVSPQSPPSTAPAPSAAPPKPTIPLPGQGPVIVKPAPSPVVPLPGTQPPVVIQKQPAIVTPAPTAPKPPTAAPTPPGGPVMATPKPEPIITKPPATATSAPTGGPVTSTPKPEPVGAKPPVTTTTKPAEPSVNRHAEEEENRRRREAEAAEAAARARDAAKASGERAKQGLAYPDVQPVVPGTAVNVAPQTDGPSSGEIRGLGAKIQQFQGGQMKEAAIPPETPPRAKPPASECEPAPPERCAAIQRQLERAKREADRRLREELRRERERAEREQRRLDREADRRERAERREANRQERERLREQERNLGRDADDIGRERDRLEGRREARENEGRDLREREQNLRRGGDPNCQSAECRQIRERQAELNQERVKDLRAETDLQRRGEKFDREYRRYRAESNDLEKRLDRGEGLDPGEHKGRTEVRERNRLADDMDRRMNELDGKDREAREKKGPPLTRAEREELNKLHGSGSGKTMGDAMRERAAEVARDIDFDRLSGMSTGELRETARDLGRSARQLGDLEKRVGMGGPQPPAGDGGPSARETELAREREKVNAEMNRIGNNMTRQDQAIRNLELARNYTGSQLKDARDKGAPPEEIRRLERKLELENHNVDRAKAEMNRLHREMGHAGDASRLLSEREGNAALANAGNLATGVVNDYNKSYGELIDEKGEVRPDRLAREVAQTERSLQQLDKSAPGSPEQKQAIDQLSRQGIDFQVDGGGKVTSWSARTPYAGAVGDAAHNAARLAELEAKPDTQLTDRQRPELQYLRNERAAAQDMVRRANQPAPIADTGGGSLTDRFKREARPGQTFQQWYAEEQQRVAVAGPAASPGQRQDAAEARERAAGATLDREAAERTRQRAGAQRTADDRAAERFLRYGRVEGETAKPEAAPAPTATSTPGQAVDASARRDAEAADRKAAATEGGLGAWRAARDRQNEQRLAELQKKPDITGAEKQEIGRLRASLDASRQQQEAERSSRPAPERVAAGSTPATPPRVVEYRDHINEELERSRRAVEQAKDGTAVDKLRASVYRQEAQINEAERDGKDTDAMHDRLASTRKELGDALQREMADVTATDAALRAALLNRHQQQADLERQERLDAASAKPRPPVSRATPPPAPSREESAAASERWAAVRPRTEAEEAAQAQKRKEEMEARERRTEEEAKERALRFGTLPPEAFKPGDTGPAAAAAEERRAKQTQRDAELASAAERRRQEMAEREKQVERDAAERVQKYGASPPEPASEPAQTPEERRANAARRDAEEAAAAEKRRQDMARREADQAAAAERRRVEMAEREKQSERDAADRVQKYGTLPPAKPKPPPPQPVQVAAVKPQPAAAPAAAPPPGPAAEPQPTARPNDAAPPGSTPMGESDAAAARARYLAGLQQELDQHLIGSELARTAVPGILAAFTDQLGPDATSALLGAVWNKLGNRQVDAAQFLEILFTEIDGRAAATGDAEASRSSRMAHAMALEALAANSALTDAQKTTLSNALHTLATRLIEENRAAAGAAKDPLQQALRQADILNLSGMLGPQDQTARTSAEAAAKALAQLFGSMKGGVAQPADLANALDSVERSLGTLPGGVDPAVVEALVGGIAEGYRALADSLRAARGGDERLRADLIVEAETREARARLATGNAVDALAALAPRQGEDAASASARAAARGALLERVVGLYAGLSPEQQARLGDVEKLKAERLNTLRGTFAAERDPQRVAAHAVPLVHALEAAGQAAEALKVATDAAARAPSNGMLQGERLRLALLAQGTQADPAGLLEAIPAEARPAAIALALDGFALAGRADLVDALGNAALRAAGSNFALAATLQSQVDLAAIDALANSGRDPAALGQRITAARNRLGPDSNLPPEQVRVVRSALDAAERQARRVSGWQQSLASGKPPTGGYIGIAREALQSGRLDIAAEAINRELRGLGGASADIKLRRLSEAQALASMVSSRLAAADVSASQRAAGNAFLTSIAEPLRGGLAELIESQRSLLRAVINARANNPQADVGGDYDAALQRLREGSRLRMELDLAAVPAAQREQRVSSSIGELTQRIAERTAEIRKEFAGLREDVLKGEARQRLDLRLAEVDALRAERDALRDIELDRAGNLDVNMRVAGGTRNVPPRTAELWSLERQLNGFNQQDGHNWDDIKLDFGRSTAGRLNNARSDRQSQRAREENPNSWLETLIVSNEQEYLERRRAQVVMEDPRLSGDARRQALQRSYRFEADAYKAEGQSYIFNDLTGTGEGHLQKSRERYAQMESQRLGWLRSDLERAGKSGDPQAFFRSLVGLREAQLAGQIETYASYLNDDWTTRGPVKGVRIGLYGAETGAALDAASAADALLHPALIRASYHPPSDLSAADREVLTDAGFMRDGRYVIPRGATEDLIRVSTAGTDFAKESTVDRYVNFRKAAELAATVVLPGGFSSRVAGSLVARAGLAELAAAAGAREVAGVVGTWVAGKTVETALFTVTSRAAQTLLDPTLILDQSAWGLGAFGSEFTHNLAVIGALGLGGGAMGTARALAANALGERIAGAGAYALFQAATGAAAITGEAALLTGLDRLVSGNAITQEDFVGNLLTVGMLKAAHGSAPDLRAEGARTARHLDRMQRRYQEWVQDRAFREIASSPPGRMLRDQYGGSWDAVRKAHRDGKISDAQMDALVRLRGQVVDALLNEIKGELGAEFEALGSVNRTSDYDLSFSGPKAELAVILFNARFGGAWRQAMGFGGSEAASRFDTNIYTRPVFDEIGRGGAADDWVQEGYAQMQARRNMDDAAWKQHVADTLAGAKDPALRARQQELLERVNQRHAEFEALVREFRPGAAAELGLRPESMDADRVTRNRLYEDALREIIGLKDALAKASTDAQREDIRSQMRAAQSRALYFAAEAYLTQAAINHVVDSVQSSGRSINARTLLGPRPETGKVRIDEDFARQSLIEQKGYIAHYLHGTFDVGTAIKVGKYFIRVLDAVQQTGRDLMSREALVRTTGLIDARRGEAPALRDALAARQIIADLRARGVDPAELGRLQAELQNARDAYDQLSERTGLSKEERKAEKERLAAAEDAATQIVLNALRRLSGGNIDVQGAANRAAAEFVQQAQNALRDYTRDLAGTQRLDPTAQLRFRRRRQPKTCGGLLRRGQVRRQRIGGESLAERVGFEPTVRV
ncbi:MAG: hypothetical protein IT513_18360 [Burkholderiales bacterium]|nr:hypothetical protein [Burkholderiales bacterium]